MSGGVRTGVFAVSAVGVAGLLAWGFAGLPSFFHFEGPYTEYLLAHAVAERHAANVVMAVTFDYRALDTLVEESILFTAVLAVALILREEREEPHERPRETQPTEVVRVAGTLAIPPLVALGLWVVGHGQATPGGGFQGGVLLAAVAVLVYLAAGYRLYRSLTPQWLVDGVESAGVLAFLAVGLTGIALGDRFLYNWIPYGDVRDLDAGGTIAILSVLVGVVVAAGFVLLFTEFLEEVAVEAGRAEADEE